MFSKIPLTNFQKIETKPQNPQSQSLHLHRSTQNNWSYFGLEKPKTKTEINFLLNSDEKNNFRKSNKNFIGKRIKENLQKTLKMRELASRTPKTCPLQKTFKKFK